MNFKQKKEGLEMGADTEKYELKNLNTIDILYSKIGECVKASKDPSKSNFKKLVADNRDTFKNSLTNIYNARKATRDDEAFKSMKAIFNTNILPIKKKVITYIKKLKTKKEITALDKNKKVCAKGFLALIRFTNSLIDELKKLLDEKNTLHISLIKKNTHERENGPGNTVDINKVLGDKDFGEKIVEIDNLMEKFSPNKISAPFNEYLKTYKSDKAVQ